MKTQVWSKERGARTLKDGVDFAEYKAKYPSAVKVKHPSQECLERWISDGVCETIDGCRVEPDGECQHGFPSWLMAFGLI